METKSRYQVIGELEQKKRELIQQKSKLDAGVTERKNAIKNFERKQADSIIAMDRALTDLKEDLENYQSNLTNEKETLDVLIQSVDDSLKRFNSQS